MNDHITLPWPDRRLHPNARCHWRQLIKPKQQARSDGYIAAKVSGLRPEPGAVHLRVTFMPPDKRRRDADSLLSNCKAAIDGIADAWKLDDRFFTYTLTMGESVRGGRVVIEIV